MEGGGGLGDAQPGISVSPSQAPRVTGASRIPSPRADTGNRHRSLKRPRCHSAHTPASQAGAGGGEMNCTRGASGAVRGPETWSVPRSQPLRAPRGPCFSGNLPPSPQLQQTEGLQRRGANFSERESPRENAHVPAHPLTSTRMSSLCDRIRSSSSHGRPRNAQRLW